jgi:hypothetical protein
VHGFATQEVIVCTKFLAMLYTCTVVAQANLTFWRCCVLPPDETVSAVTEQLIPFSAHGGTNPVVNEASQSTVDPFEELPYMSRYSQK